MGNQVKLSVEEASYIFSRTDLTVNNFEFEKFPELIRYLEVHNMNLGFQG